MKSTTVEQRLSELVAVKQAKGKKLKQAKKEVKKVWLGKTSKKWAANTNKKKGLQRTDKQKELKQADKVAAESHELVGKVFKCIAADASHLWQNAECRMMAVLQRQAWWR